MYPASNEFVSKLDTAPLLVRLTLSDGRVIPENPGDFRTDPIKSVKFTGFSSDSGTATIGCAVSAGAEVELDRSLLESVEFGSQKLQIEIGMALGGGHEWVPMGIYRIQKPKKTDDMITLQCADDIGTVLEHSYEPLTGFDFESGVSGRAFLSALCARRGIPVNMEGLPDVILKIISPEDLTERQIVAALAGLWGKFACMDRTGTLRFRWYSPSGAQIGPEDYYEAECVCGDPFHASYLKCYNTTLAETLVAGDGAGQQGMYFECPWCQQEQLDALWENLQGFSYNSVENVRILGNPLLDPWDMVTLTDVAGNVFDVPVLEISHEYDGGLITEISAPGQSSTEAQEGPVQREFKRVTAQIIKRQNSIEMEVTSQREELEGMEIGGRNLIRNSRTLEFEDYFFSGGMEPVLDEGWLDRMILD